MLAAHPKIDGVAFTGSTETARLINAGIAGANKSASPLIAETGGINARILDSTAQMEQVVMDIIGSAFQSAGQPCSASRIVNLQEDISEQFLNMLFGAMDELAIGDPWNTATDIGPLIDEESKLRVDAHIQAARTERSAAEAMRRASNRPFRRTGGAEGPGNRRSGDRGFRPRAPCRDIQAARI